MIIDSHQHFWQYNSQTHSWIDDTMSSIRKDFLPSDLKATFEKQKEYGSEIEGCVVVQVDTNEKETEFLLEICESNSFVKGAVGWVDLLAENVEDRLSFFSQNKNFKGVRHILQGESVDFVLREDFQRGISKLSQFDLTYDVLIFPPQIKNAIEMIKKFPQQKFVLDHLAKPYIKDGKITEWQKDIENLAKNKNVYCKISGMVTEHDFKNWQKQDFVPYMDVVVENFGTERILFGSDWPVCLVAAEYQQVIEIVNDYFQQFSSIEKENFFYKNCQNFYSL